MPFTTSRASRRGRVGAACWLLLGCVLQSACSYAPPPAFPRPARPLPAEIAARFALPEQPVLLHQTATDTHGTSQGELRCGGERIRFHLHRTDRAERPLVLLVPILAGGRDLMKILARQLVGKGYHAAWCERVAPALKPPQRGPQLEQLFRRTVLHQRALLAWLEEQEDPRPTLTFALGVSMGGMVATVLAAVEPSLAGTALCMAGGDVPAIVIDSAETRIISWRNWRQEEDGLSGVPLQQELQQHLLSDPGRIAPYVDTERVFVVATSFDAVVAPEYQKVLWEALGRPARLTVPLGHYTAALALNGIIKSIADFFDERTLAEAARRRDLGEVPHLARRRTADTPLTDSR